MTASARIQAELDDFADLTRAAQELLSVVDSLETVQKLQPLLRVEDRGDGDALDLGSSLADEPSADAEPDEPSADDVLWHERCRVEWSGMPEIEARTGWEQVYTDAALHQTIFGDGDSAVAHPFVLLNVGRAEQLRRFLKRESDPLKQWKLSRIDVEGLQKWDDYSSAISETLDRSHSGHAAPLPGAGARGWGGRARSDTITLSRLGPHLRITNGPTCKSLYNNRPIHAVHRH